MMVTKSANFSASIQNYQIYVLYKNQGFYVDHFLQMSLMNDSLPEKKREGDFFVVSFTGGWMNVISFEMLTKYPVFLVFLKLMNWNY